MGFAAGRIAAQQRAALKLSDDRPAIATGHQTELFHSGVWAKLAMIDAAARALDADCLFAAIDSDAPKHLQFRWPGKSRPITDDPAWPAPNGAGCSAPRRERMWSRLKSAFESHAEHWSFTPPWPGNG